MPFFKRYEINLHSSTVKSTMEADWYKIDCKKLIKATFIFYDLQAHQIRHALFEIGYWLSKSFIFTFWNPRSNNSFKNPNISAHILVINKVLKPNRPDKTWKEKISNEFHLVLFSTAVTLYSVECAASRANSSLSLNVLCFNPHSTVNIVLFNSHHIPDTLN